MRKNREPKGFTLGELMVGIAIISTIFVGVANMNFSRSSDTQKLQIEATRIITLFEERRNNALIGKGVLASLETPTSWTVTVDASGSGAISSYYTLASSATGGLKSWIPPTSFSLSNLECVRLDGASETISGVIALDYEGPRGLLRGCSDDRFKKVRIEISKGVISKSIIINALTGTIEKD